MNSPNSIVIEINGLSKSFKDVQALKSLNLTVKQNSIFGFLGPNGAGKTTTIKLLLGLAHPTSGSATIFGKDIPHNSVKIRKGDVLPWNLVMDLGPDKPALAVLLAQGLPLHTVTPIIWTAVLAVIFLTIALWRFSREEF